MTSFYQFIRSENDSPTLGLSPPRTFEVENLISVDVAARLDDENIHPGKTTEFSEKLAKFITSNDFLKELSTEIGNPHLSETKEQFVARCSKSMESILKDRLG